jgi:AraC-like DNA-binding protein
MPVSEIAVALGYTDPANFSRAFRQTTGIAPTEHRARHG